MRRKVIAAPRNAAEVVAVAASLVLCCGAAAAVAQDSGVRILPSVRSVLTQEVPAGEGARQVAAPDQTRVASRTPGRTQPASPTDAPTSSVLTATPFDNPLVSDFPPPADLPPVLTEHTPVRAGSPTASAGPSAVDPTPFLGTPSPPPAPEVTAGPTDTPTSPSGPTGTPADPTPGPSDPTDPTDPTPGPTDPTEPTPGPTDPTGVPSGPTTPDPTLTPTLAPTDAPSDEPTDPPAPTPMDEVTPTPAPTLPPTPE